MSALAGDAPATIGIDVGGTKMLGLALAADGTALAEERRPSVPPGPDPGHPAAASALIDALAELARSVAARACEQVGRAPGALGVGLPGLVDDVGRLRFAPNLAAGDDVDVGRRLAEKAGMPVVADNDATCAAIGEWVMGAGTGLSDVLVVTLGTGIGGGIVSGGRVLRGAQRFSGEVGHMVVDPSGPRCTCGKRGCWERFASGSGLARLAREAAHAGRLAAVVHMAHDDPDAVRGEHVTTAARAGDAEAQAVLDELGWWIALGLSNLALVLDPEMIVVGGGLVDALALVLPTVRDAFSSMLEGASRRPEIPIVPAALGDRAGAIGAAIVARA